MADICDQAEQHIEKTLASSIAEIRKRATQTRQSDGCLFCGEVDLSGSFCDAFCRDTYEQSQKMNRITGRH